MLSEDKNTFIARQENPASSPSASEKGAASSSSQINCAPRVSHGMVQCGVAAANSSVEMQ